jgi:tetratricopeptide (TPR) repeat protein
MIVLAAAFGTFVLFLFLGLLALPVTAVLDKGIGKEKALLLYAVILLAFSFLVLSPDKPAKGDPRPRAENEVPVAELSTSGNPFQRADPDHDLERNVFKPFSDTQPLPPVTLDPPPWISLEFALPPTIPGPAPGHRQVLRGALPALSAGDGTSIAQIPDAVFQDYQVQPQDVYDWVKEGGQNFYVYILEIDGGNGWVEEAEPGFEALKWRLADANSEGWDDLRVRAAFIGSAGKAEKALEPLDVLKMKRTGRVEKPAREHDRWYLRRTVDNQFVEARRRHGVGSDYATARVDPAKLESAASDMADVGRSGKEGRDGWKRAVELLQIALRHVRETSGPAIVADYLLELLKAQRALRDEQAVLRTLAEYFRTAPNSAEAPTWLGRLHLDGMQLPREALQYFRTALERNARYVPALIGAGDALSFMGRHQEALQSYNRASSEEEAQLRRAVAELRLGRVDAARSAAEGILSRNPSAADALLIRAAALYTQGDLQTARAAFEQLAAMPDGNEQRARACYNLGLTCVRLGQRDAALAAFEACERALRQGSSPGPTPDETVSPALGRAIVAYAEKNDGAMRTALDQTRRQAPRNAYAEMFAGMVASLDGNDASAVRALDAALRHAPGYAELDGWLAKTYLRLGQRELETGASPKSTAETFERAIAFAERAADREMRGDKLAYAARLRECLVRIGAGHLPKKQRYGEALAAAELVLSINALREQPAALALSGYGNFQIDRFDECIRKFQSVLDVVPEEADGARSTWRQFAEISLAAVKHWRSLEEKVVEFKSVNLDRQWTQDEKRGVNVRVEEERLHFEGEATADGRLESPTVTLTNKSLFQKESFEKITLSIRIPRTNRGGQAVNNVTFGVQVLAASRAGRQRAKTPGIGIFYDKAKVAVRIGGGQIKTYKDGSLQRLDPPVPWPGDEDMTIRIVREDAAKGTLAVYLNEELVIRDNISGFKQTKGPASLWIGGYSTETEPFDVHVGDIRVIRHK